MILTRSYVFALTVCGLSSLLTAGPVQTVVLQDFEGGTLPTLDRVRTSNSSASGDSFTDIPTVETESGSKRLKVVDPGGGVNGVVVTIPGALPEPGHFLITADIKVAAVPSGPIFTYGMATKVGAPSTIKVLDTNAGYVLNLTGNPTTDITKGYQTIGASVQVPAGGSFPKDLTLYFSTDPSGSPQSGHAAFGDFSGSHRSVGTSLPAASNTSAVYVDNIKRIGPGNFGEERHAWISVGDGMTNLTTLGNHITNAYNNGFNCIDILVRYRTNRYFNNNRNFNTYPNNEPYVSEVTDGTDPIQFAIDRAHALGMRVYGSYSCFLATDGDSYPGALPSGSVTYTYNGGSPVPQSGSGLWADPGRADVRDYNINVVMDLVQNYDLDGIIFDRIRYASNEYGYNPVALAEMGYAPGVYPAPTDATFMQKRRDAITTFLHDAYEAITDLKPWMIVGTVPIAYTTRLTDTYNSVFQSWPDWSAVKTSNRVISFGAQDLIQPQFYRMWNQSSPNTAPGGNRLLMNHSVYGDTGVMARDYGLMPGANTNFAPLFYSETISNEADASGTAQALADNICDTQSGTYFTNGSGIYNVTTFLNGIIGSSVISRIRAATTPCGPDVMAPAAPLSDFLMKEGYDNTPPNPVSVTVNNTGSFIQLNWATPAPAADGEIPVRYMVYRSTASNVLPYYSNQLVPAQSITGTSFTDGPFMTGTTYYYRVVAVDDYNNKSASTVVGPYTVNAAPSVIVESRQAGSPGVLTPSPAYTESPAMLDTTSKSSAAGAVGFGARYSTAVNLVATFRPNLPSAGGYNVYVTLDDSSGGPSNNALAEYTITGTGAPVVGQVQLIGSDSSLANQWKLLASNVPFAAGTGGTIAFRNINGDGGGALPGNRFTMDAVQFQLSSSSVQDWQLY